jgi:hypothetical protein
VDEDDEGGGFGEDCDEGVFCVEDAETSFADVNVREVFFDVGRVTCQSVSLFPRLR